MKGTFVWFPEDLSKVDGLIKRIFLKRVVCRIFLTSERVVGCRKPEYFGEVGAFLVRLLAGRKIAFEISLLELTSVEIVPRSIVQVGLHLVLHAADGSKYQLALGVLTQRAKKTDLWRQTIADLIQVRSGASTGG
jgi:hypothetical protein